MGDQEKLLATTQLIQQEQGGFHGRVAWGTAHFNQHSRLMVRIRDQTDAIVLIPNKDLVLGRSDAKSNQVPDLDLAAYGAAEQGVSRRHAIIRRGEDTLMLVDLESTNGTYLNGQRLLPNQPRVLRDGDEIRLGRLVFHLFFK